MDPGLQKVLDAFKRGEAGIIDIADFIDDARFREEHLKALQSDAMYVQAIGDALVEGDPEVDDALGAVMLHGVDSDLIRSRVRELAEAMPQKLARWILSAALELPDEELRAFVRHRSLEEILEGRAMAFGSLFFENFAGERTEEESRLLEPALTTWSRFEFDFEGDTPHQWREAEALYTKAVCAQLALGNCAESIPTVLSRWQSAQEDTLPY